MPKPSPTSSISRLCIPQFLTVGLSQCPQHDTARQSRRALGQHETATSLIPCGLQRYFRVRSNHYGEFGLSGVSIRLPPMLQISCKPLIPVHHIHNIAIKVPRRALRRSLSSIIQQHILITVAVSFPSWHCFRQDPAFKRVSSSFNGSLHLRKHASVLHSAAFSPSLRSFSSGSCLSCFSQSLIAFMVFILCILPPPTTIASYKDVSTINPNGFPSRKR